ncbi:MAG: HaeII family restriction endonuclease [Fimbriimonadales bacterium]
MPEIDIQALKNRLDKFIGKQRVAMYKPIQVAEILYRSRNRQIGVSIDLGNVETYRNPSKRWRDEVTKRLLGQVCTSSQKFQDNLFEPNAIPPDMLMALAFINEQYGGVVERYIYQQFWKRQKSIIATRKYIEDNSRNFDLREFLGFFEKSVSGMRRSIDKAYEIVVYALFVAVLSIIEAEIVITADTEVMRASPAVQSIAQIVLGISVEQPQRTLRTNIFRAGVANAADTGVDMWANFGPVFQVKHIDLSEEDVEEITREVKADELIIVCKDKDKKIIQKVVFNIGATSHVRAIITKSDLVQWYTEVFGECPISNLRDVVIRNLQVEFDREFPFSDTLPEFYRERGYDKIAKPSDECPFWEDDEF